MATESTLPAPRSRLAALIDEARRRGRRRHLVLASIGLLALFVAGGIWASLQLSGGGGTAVQAPPGFHFVESEGPVARRVLETWNSAQPVSVDIATGTAQPVRSTTAIWYDDGGGLSREVTRADGQVQHDNAFACPRSAPRPCIQGSFSFEKYWPLDLSRFTRQPGIGTFHGRSVIWIAPRQPGGVPAPTNFGERIGLDPRTHQPVADRMYFNGKISTEALVLKRQPDIAGKYVFVVPDASAGRLRGKDPAPELSERGSNPHALQARLALGQKPFWLGERFRGRRLEAVTIGSTFGTPAGIGPKAERYVFYDYGNVAIVEFNARDLPGSQGASLPGRMTVQTPDTLMSPDASPSVSAQLIRSGVLVFVQPSQHGKYVLDRAGALGVARTLRPVPQP
jgi:hypothetical protein